MIYTAQNKVTFQISVFTILFLEKMSQENNGENTDLECDLVLCKNMDSDGWMVRKEDITRLEAFEMWIWRRMEKISWTEYIHVSNEEVLKLVERSLLTIIRTKTTELDGPYNERGLTSKRNNRGKNGG